MIGAAAVASIPASVIFAPTQSNLILSRRHINNNNNNIKGYRSKCRAVAGNFGHFVEVVKKDVDFVKKNVSAGVKWTSKVLGLPEVVNKVDEVVWLRNVEDPKYVEEFHPPDWPQPCYPELSGTDLIMADLKALEAYMLYYYQLSKMWTKPLPEVYNAEEADIYFKCRPHIVALRLIEVFGSFASAAIKIRLDGIKRSKNLSGSSEVDEYDSQYNFGMVLKETMLNLGPTFIKVGQSLSTRPDIIGFPISKALSELHDQIPPFPRALAMKIIEEEFGSPVETFFSYISEEAVAAASFGQVYKAKTVDGHDVAVKVQRPNLRHVVFRDIYIMRVGLDILQQVTKRKSDLRLYADELGKGLVGELDYTMEAANAVEFMEAHSPFPSIRVPKVFQRLTQKRVLTMEWMSGENPKELLSICNSNSFEQESQYSEKQRIEGKNPVGNTAAQRRRQNAVSVGKERREALFRTKRLCRVGVSSDVDVPVDSDMMIEEEQSILEAQTASAVEELKAAIAFQGKGAVQKKVNALRELRRLLSRSEFPPIETAIASGAIPLLAQCLSFGSQDEQLLEAAWCLTNIAAGKPEETRALLPALPLLIAHIGEKSSMLVAEQCAWALGNVAGEGEDLRHILISQGALLPLAKMMFPNKGSTVRTAGWALSNLIKGPDPKAATELIKIDGVVEAILRHLKKSDEEIATEIAWVVVYLSALSPVATSVLVKTDLLQLLVERLVTSDSLQLLIPVLRSLGNLIAGDTYTTNAVLVPGHEITDNIILALVKCLKSEHRVLKKEAAWVLSNIAAGSVGHKQLIYKSEAMPLLIQLLATSPFDIKKEVAYVVGNLCVAPAEGSGRSSLIFDHLASFVRSGCLRGFIDLVRSADIEAARLGLQFMELVLRGLPNGEGQKLVEKEDGIDAMERFQFHENEDLRNMANQLVDKYFGADYGLDE